MRPAKYLSYGYARSEHLPRGHPCGHLGLKQRQDPQQSEKQVGEGREVVEPGRQTDFWAEEELVTLGRSKETPVHVDVPGVAVKGGEGAHDDEEVVGWGAFHFTSKDSRDLNHESSEILACIGEGLLVSLRVVVVLLEALGEAEPQRDESYCQQVVLQTRALLSCRLRRIQPLAISEIAAYIPDVLECLSHTCEYISGEEVAELHLSEWRDEYFPESPAHHDQVGAEEEPLEGVEAHEGHHANDGQCESRDRSAKHKFHLHQEGLARQTKGPNCKHQSHGLKNHIK